MFTLFIFGLFDVLEDEGVLRSLLDEEEMVLSYFISDCEKCNHIHIFLRIQRTNIFITYLPEVKRKNYFIIVFSIIKEVQ